MWFQSDPGRLTRLWIADDAGPLFIWVIGTLASWWGLLYLIGPGQAGSNCYLLVVVAAYLGSRLREPARARLLRRYPDLAPSRSLSIRGRRTLWSVILVAAAATTIDTYSCYHGAVYGIVNVGIARSENGGPCNNYLYDLKSMHITGDWYVWWSR